MAGRGLNDSSFSTSVSRTGGNIIITEPGIIIWAQSKGDSWDQVIFTIVLGHLELSVNFEWVRE